MSRITQVATQIAQVAPQVYKTSRKYLFAVAITAPVIGPLTGYYLDTVKAPLNRALDEAAFVNRAISECADMPNNLRPLCRDIYKRGYEMGKVAVK